MGYPPTWTWDGVPPYLDLRWGTPPPHKCGQTENITSRHPSDAGGKNQQSDEKQIDHKSTTEKDEKSVSHHLDSTAARNCESSHSERMRISEQGFSETALTHSGNILFAFDMTRIKEEPPCDAKPVGECLANENCSESHVIEVKTELFSQTPNIQEYRLSTEERKISGGWPGENNVDEKSHLLLPQSSLGNFHWSQSNMRNQLKGDKKQFYVCGKCGKSYSREQGLVQHERTHTQVKNRSSIKSAENHSGKCRV